MSVVKITHTYLSNGEECQNIYHYYNYPTLPTLAQAATMLDDFHDNILPAVRAIQTDDVVYTGLSMYVYHLVTSIDRAVTGTGDIVAALIDVIPPDIVLNVRRYVGGTIVHDTGAAYTGLRPIRRGRSFLSGLPKAFMNGNGFNNASTYAAEFAAYQSAMLTPLDAGSGVLFDPVVFGYALPALPPSPTYPAGRPLRPYVVAPITLVNAVDFTNLSSRDD